MPEGIENFQPPDIIKPLEATTKIEKFTDEDKKFLEKEGYIFIESTGQSIEDLRKEGYEIKWTKDPIMRQKLNDPSNGGNDEKEPSLRTEIAIKPEEFFLPEKFMKKSGKRIDEDLREVIPLTYQEALDNFTEIELSEKAPGSKAALLNPATWAKIAFEYEKTSGKKLFGDREDRKYKTAAQTKSVKWNFQDSNETSGVCIGFQQDKGITITDFRGGQHTYGLDLARAIIPKSAGSQIKK